MSSTDELGLRQTEGRKLLARRRTLFENAECKSLYESRKQLIERLDKVKIELKDNGEKERLLQLRSDLLHTRLQELLTLLEAKTRQYTGQDIHVERPLPTPASA